MSGSLLDNDSDPDTTDTLRISAINGEAIVFGEPTKLPSGATITVFTNGDFLYDPGETFRSLSTGETALEEFTYTIVDALGETSTASVQVVVEGVGTSVVTENLLAAHLTPDLSQVVAGATPSPSADLKVNALSIVLEAVRGLGGNQSAVGLSAEAPVLEAVNGVSDLGSSKPVTSVADAVQSVEVKPKFGLARWVGKFFDEFGLQTERALPFEFEIDVTTAGLKVVSFDVTTTDGSPLPSWINMDPATGLLTGEIPVGTEDVSLRARIILEDGTTILRSLSIDSATGEVQLAPEDEQAALGKRVFSDQLAVAAGGFDAEVSALERTIASLN